jgi:divalent metal cation (Fe/Co/Zn/Cd) transporter
MALLAATTLFILYHTFDKIFFHPGVPLVTAWSFGVLIFALVVDLFRAGALRKAARDYGSQALALDCGAFY